MATAQEIQNAARAHVHGLATEALLTPRELAEGAWYPGCGKTVDQLEAEIRDSRGLPPKSAKAS